MRTFSVVFMGVCCFFAGALFAAEKTWTGGLPVGSYGSSSSSAQYKSALFTGTGVLNVLCSEGAGTLISVR
ncbi:MAG TPA: hypothetical protein PKM57_05710 [Kiritimatiellia bacterium]|nr:hypothetical protein [Kiritimatiellia bacterium]HPS09206.1 hypothetical protein [Kiritimatiellia bacterium]